MHICTPFGRYRSTGLGSMPTSSILRTLGLRSFPPGSTLSSSSTTPILATGLPSIVGITNLLQPSLGGGESSKMSDNIVVTPGIPALKRSMVELILSGKYVDLGELPPAKGFSKPLTSPSSSLEGQVVLLQAADVLRTRRLIPDLATWTQCFAIYTAVLGTKHPTRVQSLLIYMAVVAKLSKKLKWPSRVIYDHNFRQEAADMGQLDWSKIDGGSMLMFLSNEGWCTLCNSMDHLKAACPCRPPDELQSRKRPIPNPKPQAKEAQTLGEPASSVPQMESTRNLYGL